MTVTAVGRAPRDLVAGRSSALAVALVRRGARFVVVGGTARRLRGSPHRPRDLDVVVAPDDVASLVVALARLGVVVPAAALHRARDAALATPWGPLDVFVRDRLPTADAVVLDGCPLAVAR